ncbi:hypothetical protein INO99_17045, partial [Staphylococcus aureus]|nr:hypothetical protein [Staphylococcus aureus]
GTERLVLGLIPLSSNDSTSLGAFCPALLALGSVVGVYGAVIALGRIKGNDTNDHGDFNGIEKTLTVNPNSELIFEFNTMTT